MSKSLAIYTYKQSTICFVPITPWLLVRKLGSTYCNQRYWWGIYDIWITWWMNANIHSIWWPRGKRQAGSSSNNCRQESFHAPWRHLAGLSGINHYWQFSIEVRWGSRHLKGSKQSQSLNCHSLPVQLTKCKQTAPAPLLFYSLAHSSP